MTFEEMIQVKGRLLKPVDFLSYWSEQRKSWKDTGKRQMLWQGDNKVKTSVDVSERIEVCNQQIDTLLTSILSS